MVSAVGGRGGGGGCVSPSLWVKHHASSLAATCMGASLITAWREEVDLEKTQRVGRGVGVHLTFSFVAVRAVSTRPVTMPAEAMASAAGG